MYVCDKYLATSMNIFVFVWSITNVIVTCHTKSFLSYIIIIYCEKFVSRIFCIIFNFKRSKTDHKRCSHVEEIGNTSQTNGVHALRVFRMWWIGPVPFIALHLGITIYTATFHHWFDVFKVKFLPKILPLTSYLFFRLYVRILTIT